MEYQFVNYSVANRLATITLNRPKKRNALNNLFVSELKDVFSNAISDDSVKIILLKAEGKAFCAGADLEYLKQINNNSLEDNLSDSNNLMELYRMIYESSKITIAQIEGDAIAGGCGLVTVCDFSFVKKGILFGYSEVKLGFTPAIVSSFLVSKIGLSKAKELLLTGNLIGASEAKEMGLINFVESEESIDRAVNSFIDHLTNQTSENSLRVTKELLNKINSLSLNDSLKLSATVNAKTRQHPDFKKGINSFINKESINW